MITDNRIKIINNALIANEFAEFCMNEELDGDSEMNIPVIFKRNIVVNDETIEAGTIAFMYRPYNPGIEQADASRVKTKIGFLVPCNYTYADMELPCTYYDDGSINVVMKSDKIALTDLVMRTDDNTAVSNLNAFEQLTEAYWHAFSRHRKHVSIIQMMIISVAAALMLGSSVWFMAPMIVQENDTDIAITSMIGLVMLVLALLTGLAYVICKISPDFDNTKTAKQITQSFDVLYDERTEIEEAYANQLNTDN